MNYTLNVHNIKCGACKTTLEKELKKLSSIHDVVVDPMNGTVQFQSDEEDSIDIVLKKLDKLGYPQNDSTFFQYKNAIHLLNRR